MCKIDTIFVSMLDVSDDHLKLIIDAIHNENIHL
jgi:hypothetical protein